MVATVMISSACTTATDESGGPVNDAPRLGSSVYPTDMNTICSTTSTALADLAAPTDEASRATWAGEVARLFDAQAAAFDEISVLGELRTDHQTLIVTTRAQADQWQALSDALAGRADAVEIGDISTEITALALGRNDLASEMGIAQCASNDVGT